LKIFAEYQMPIYAYRCDECGFTKDVLQKIWVLRKLLYPMDDLEAMEFLLDKIKATKSNNDFFDSMRRG